MSTQTAPGPRAPDLRRLLVVSPHFDDAVLSCGHILAEAEEARSVTVFGGAPDHYPDPPTAWDHSCGFARGDDIIGLRRAEDAEALARLNATAVVLDFVDLQYRGRTKIEQDALTAALCPVFDELRPTTVAIPLAIQHPDHRASMVAMLALRRRDDEIDWLCYAEFPYVWLEPGLAMRRLGWFQRRRMQVTPVMTSPSSPIEKAAALRAYRSQILGLELEPLVDDIATLPEQLWRLSDRSPLPVRTVRWAGYRTGVLK